MKRAPWLLLAVLLPPLAARAEGKCGDAPFRLDKDLVVTWVLPVPADAKVEQLPPDKCPASLGGRRFERDLGKFAKGRFAGAAATGQVPAARGPRPELPPTGSLQELRAWEAQFQVPPDEEAQAAIQSYLDDGYKMYGALVVHPRLKDDSERLRRSYTQCSCTVQRAVIVHDGKTERIYLRSHFLSARRRGADPVAFRPGWCLLVTTATDRLWFPQRFNALILQDRARVDIDLLTPGPATLGALPPPLTRTAAPDQRFEERSWKVQVIAGDVPTDRPDPKDLSVALTVQAQP